MRLRTRRLVVVACAGTLIAIGAGTLLGFQSRQPQPGLRFNSDGELIRPKGYREWIYIGTPHTPNDLNNGNAPFPEFHSVYIDPKSWEHFRNTGEFREGTMLVKELVSVSTKVASSGAGYFMGEFLGLEAAVKSKLRFPDEPGNWAYFSFGHEYPLADTATAFPSQTCNACHASSAADDFVFTQYYPALRARTAPAEWKGPAFDADRQLVRPEGYRDWVYVGTPLTPHDMNAGAAPFPEFHSVYIDRASWAHYKNTGEFREGTTLVKELVSVGSKVATSGAGYFMGEFIGLEATIKSKEHFPDEPGNWAYFSFGHEYPLANAAKVQSYIGCNACHAKNAAEDFVFTQFYPVLRAGNPGAKSHDSKTCKECQEAARRLAMASATAQKPSSETPDSVGGIPTGQNELFRFLVDGKYKDFPTNESKTHPSSGPHANFGHPVRVYMNASMNDAFKASAETLPKGAAAVKEMFHKDGTLEGWAVMLKTQDESDGGKGWFWYEVTSTTDSSAFRTKGNGVPTCFGCHSVGNDFVLTSHPLQ